MSKSFFQYLSVGVAGGCFALLFQSFLTPSAVLQPSAQVAAQRLNSSRGAQFGEIPNLANSSERGVSALDNSAFFAQASPLNADALDLSASTPSDSAISPRLALAPTKAASQEAATAEDFAARLSELGPEERRAVEIYEKRNKSVVNVSTLETKTNLIFQQTAEGCGSGVVLNSSGVILTNFHVVENANHIEVTLFNGETYPATPIGLDPNTDVALLKIDAPAEFLFPIEFGDSSRLLVGQTVYAIGNPFGLERTMTRGIVSNLNRTIGSPQQFRQIKGVIQIDAAINPGNSGGLLVDSRGKMIGMNTAIASRVGENSGVGFAVPVNTIHRIATILLEKGEVVRGDAGVVQVTETENGLIPGLIDAEGAADRAGLRGGKLTITITQRNGIQYQSRQVRRPKEGFDLIIGVNGQPVKTGEDFITAVEEHAPGETIVLNIVRRGQEMELPIVLK